MRTYILFLTDFSVFSSENGVILLITVSAILLILFFSRPIRLHIKSGKLHISGIQEKSIDINRITHVWFSDTLPAGIVREKENSLFSTYNAKRYSPDKSEVYIILLNASHNRYLYIRTTDKETIVWNDKDRKYMEYVAETLLNNINKRV